MTETNSTFKKGLDYVNRYNYLLILFALGIIFYLSLGLRLESVNEPYLLAADPHYWYVTTKYYIDGDVPETDPLRNHLAEGEINHGFFPLFTANTYKIANAITGIEFYRYLFWFPAVVASLAIFPAFWIGKELYSNLAGLFTAFFIGITPSFVSRSMAGFFDTDCMNILLSMLVVAFFLAAYNRVDPKNLKKISPIALSIVTGSILGIFALNWSGFAYMPWIFMGLFGLHWIYRVLLAEGNTITEKLNSSWLFFRGHLLIYILILASFLIVTFPFQGLQPINEVIRVTTFFQSGKAEGGIFPNVWISISEEMSASLDEIIVRLGAPIFFFGIVGVIILFIYFIANFGKKSIYPETFFMMLIWILPTLYGSLWAVRFIQMLALPMAICAGIALGVIFKLAIDLIKKNY